MPKENHPSGFGKEKDTARDRDYSDIAHIMRESGADEDEIHQTISRQRELDEKGRQRTEESGYDTTLGDGIRRSDRVLMEDAEHKQRILDEGERYENDLDQ